MNHRLLWLTLLQRWSLLVLITTGLINPTHTRAQIITTVAGSSSAGYGGDGGGATAAKLSHPSGVAVDGSGNLYIADQSNNRIRKVSNATGIITTVAGNGALYDDAGNGRLATAAKLDFPTGIAVDGSGNLYIADTQHYRIRKVSNATGVITTVAGSGDWGFGGDGGIATIAELNRPSGVAVDGSGNLYIADQSNNRIRKVSRATGIITTVAGDGAMYGDGSGDGGVATAAQLNYPSGVAVDGSSNFYISDTRSNRIRKVVLALTTTAPVATTNPNQTATVNTAFSYTVNAFTDAETPNNLTYSARINPTNGLSFNSTTRVIAGTLTISAVSSVTITATDPGSLSASTTFTITSTTACTGTLSLDYGALAQLYNATNGPNWTNKTNWLRGCSPCDWYGVSCNSDGRVTTLSLSDNQLSGTIPVSLSALTNLQGLYLYDNQLSGTIPAGLSTLPNLQALYLSNNQLSGAIPANLGTLSKLTNLDLSTNQLSGPIPTGLGALTKLQFLILNNNQLSGCFPTSLSALCGGDRVVDFSSNPGLPGGGNFSLFCANGSGRCSLAPGNTPPVATANTNQTATVGTAFSYTINAFADAETPNALTYTARINPANGLIFNPNTRVISGTPTTSGISSVTITATDPGNLSASNTFGLLSNLAPVTPKLTVPFGMTGVTGVSCQTVTAGQRRVTFTPQYTGLTNQPVSFWVVNELAPTTNPGPYTLSLYTDNPTITLKAQQGTATTSFAFNWLAACSGTVTPGPNTAPTVAQAIPNQSATVGQGFRLAIPGVTFTDAQTPAQLSVSVSGLPLGLSFAGGVISGTPSVSGTTTVRVTATDPGNLSASTTFGLTVSPKVTPTPTGSFTMTGVTMVSCQAVSAGQRRVSFSPQYAGLTNQPVSFGVTNEMVPTTNPGPYTLNLYTDNPTITLNAQQGNATTTLRYNWLAACNANGRLGAEPTPELTVLVLGNPVTGESVEVEVRGAAGQRLHLQAVNGQGRVISQITLEQAGLVERRTLGLERPAGLYFLQVSTPTRRQVVKVLKP